MTVKEFALNLIENADDTPLRITETEAAEYIGWAENLPDGITPSALAEAWNDIISEFEDKL